MLLADLPTMSKCTRDVYRANEYWIYISALENSLLFSSCHQSVVLIAMSDFRSKKQDEDLGDAEEGLRLPSTAAGGCGWLKRGFLGALFLGPFLFIY